MSTQLPFLFVIALASKPYKCVYAISIQLVGGKLQSHLPESPQTNHFMYPNEVPHSFWISQFSLENVKCFFFFMCIPLALHLHLSRLSVPDPHICLSSPPQRLFVYLFVCCVLFYVFVLSVFFLFRHVILCSVFTLSKMNQRNFARETTQGREP